MQTSRQGPFGPMVFLSQKKNCVLPSLRPLPDPPWEDRVQRGRERLLLALRPPGNSDFHFGRVISRPDADADSEARTTCVRRERSPPPCNQLTVGGVGVRMRVIGLPHGVGMVQGNARPHPPLDSRQRDARLVSISPFREPGTLTAQQGAFGEKKPHRPHSSLVSRGGRPEQP